MLPLCLKSHVRVFGDAVLASEQHPSLCPERREKTSKNSSSDDFLASQWKVQGNRERTLTKLTKGTEVRKKWQRGHWDQISESEYGRG